MRYRTFLLTALAVSACSSSEPNDTNDGDSDTSSTNTYLEGLPAWPATSADNKGATGPATDDYLTGSDNRTYRCTTTPYSLTTTPEKIVTFNPTVDVLWPGALIQGRSYQQGLLEALSITARAPLTVSIPTLLFAGNSRIVENPTVATVQAAIGEIIGAATTQGVAASSSISYTQTTAYSAEQAALDVGVSASYIGGSVQTSLQLATSSDLHSVVGYFVQNMFTVTIPQPERPADLFSSVSEASINNAIAAGQLGPDNLPVYVSAVTYGRIMMFSITSRASTQEIQAALNAQYSGLVVDGSVSTKYAELMQNGSTTFHVVTVGGDATNAEEMIRTGDPSAFFGSNPQISTAVPISYALRNLGNNSFARLSETTSYSVRTCVESATGAGADVYVIDSTPATGDGTLRAYDSVGAEFTLAHPLSEPTQYYNDIIWDSLHDRFFIARDPESSGPSTVIAVNPDGSLVDPQPSFALAAAEYVTGMVYEPKFSQIYMTIEIPAADDEIRKYNTNGVQVGNSFFVGGSAMSSIAYEPKQDLIYVTLVNGGVRAYRTNGDLALQSNDAAHVFEGLKSASDMVYDSHHDLFYIAECACNTSVAGFSAFTPAGVKVGTVNTGGNPLGIAYDPVNERILVADQLNAIILVYNAAPPDFAPVAIINGQFSGLNGPNDIVYRP